jgi:Kef-type K+ transport system membrane component KefB
MYDALVDRFSVVGFPVALAVAFALLMAYLATLFGLADIVGAFAGGLILAQTKGAHKIFVDLRPIAVIFVSFFFVTLGMKVDLTQMQAADGTSVIGPVVLIGLVLTLVAMAAKLTCGWGVLSDARANRLVVGVGMAPRGEVGLIFAVLGLDTGLITNWQYTAIIVVVLLTTFITPIWLKRLSGKFFDAGGRPPGPKAEDASRILKV